MGRLPREGRSSIWAPRRPHAEVTALPKVRAAEPAAGLRERQCWRWTGAATWGAANPMLRLCPGATGQRAVNLTWRTTNLTDPCRLFPSSLCPAWICNFRSSVRGCLLRAYSHTAASPPCIWFHPRCGSMHAPSSSSCEALADIQAYNLHKTIAGCQERPPCAFRRWLPSASFRSDDPSSTGADSRSGPELPYRVLGRRMPILLCIANPPSSIKRL